VTIEAYQDTLKLAKDNVALRHMLESLIDTETSALTPIGHIVERAID
jgi:hypothetical protein